MKSTTKVDNTAFDWLLSIVDELRENCPWDQKQTMESLRHLVIEETFELSEAILADSTDEIKKELGDLLLHIVLYARIAAEKQAFTITEVIQALCNKLIHRHPHIYGQEKASDAQAATKSWEQFKLYEKKNYSVLEGVPKTLPSLIKAMRIQEKASMAGFDHQRIEEVWQLVQEKTQELTDAINQCSTTTTKQDKIQEELGNLLFALVNYARFIEVNPETALEKANQKFIQRFQHVEQQIRKQGKQLSQLSPKQLSSYWEQAKEHSKP